MAPRSVSFPAFLIPIIVAIFAVHHLFTSPTAASALAAPLTAVVPALPTDAALVIAPFAGTAVVIIVTTPIALSLFFTADPTTPNAAPLSPAPPPVPPALAPVTPPPPTPPPTRGTSPPQARPPLKGRDGGRRQRSDNGHQESHNSHDRQNRSYDARDRNRYRRNRGDTDYDEDDWDDDKRSRGSDRTRGSVRSDRSGRSHGSNRSGNSRSSERSRGSNKSRGSRRSRGGAPPRGGSRDVDKPYPSSTRFFEGKDSTMPNVHDPSVPFTARTKKLFIFNGTYYSFQSSALRSFNIAATSITALLSTARKGAQPALEEWWNTLFVRSSAAPFRAFFHDPSGSGGLCGWFAFGIQIFGCDVDSQPTAAHLQSTVMHVLHYWALAYVAFVLSSNSGSAATSLMQSVDISALLRAPPSTFSTSYVYSLFAFLAGSSLMLRLEVGPGVPVASAGRPDHWFEDVYGR